MSVVRIYYTMANVTDPFAEAVHGTNPQNLVEKITRLKIYESLYWKEQCFGLTAETLIDKAVMLKYCGGIYGGNVKPTPFLCLTLKLLQLQPEKEIIYEFIKNEDVSLPYIVFAFIICISLSICDLWVLFIFVLSGGPLKCIIIWSPFIMTIANSPTALPAAGRFAT